MDEYKNILNFDEQKQSAEIKRADIDGPFDFQRIRIDLSDLRNESNPKEIRVPCKSVYVVRASSPQALVRVSPNKRDIGSLDNYVEMNLRDSIEFGKSVSGLNIQNEAQAGEWVELIVSVNSIFRSGQQISVNAGGVSINDGSSIVTNELGSAGNASQVTIGITPVMILPADANRKVATLYFTGSVWVGDASVQAGGGVGVLVSGILVYRNTAALYACAGAGSSTVSGTIEK